MASTKLTDEQVEEEIAKLRASEDVRLALRYRQYRTRRRQYLYGLRQLEKNGKALREQGYNLGNIKELFEEDDEYGIFSTEQ